MSDHPLPTSAEPRVLVVVNDLYPYGAQRVASTVAAELVHLAASVQVVTTDVPTSPELPVGGEVGRASLGRQPGGGARSLLRTVVAARRLIRRARPDVVIANMLYANIVVLLSTRGMRCRPVVLVTEHNVTQNLAAEGRPAVMRFLARRLYPRADRVVCVSRGVAADVGSTYRVPDRLLRTIHNPVDVEAVRRQAMTPVEHPWFPPAASTPVVACVAGFRHAKGHDLLLEALTCLPDVRAVLIGEGPLRFEIEQLTQRLGLTGRVDFLGHQAAPMAYVRQCAALVMPSRWEGFGLVAVEAAAVAVPVVGTDVAGVNELVGHSVPGVLVAADPAAIAAGIRDVLSHPPGTAADLDPFAPAAVATAYLQAANA